MVAKHILMVLSSNERGWHISQLAHSFDLLTSNGHKVTICSIAGGNAPVAEISYQDVDCAEFESNAVKMDLCRNSLPLKYFSGRGFDCILLIGGPGAMFDFHQCIDVSRVVSECYEQHGGHGIIAAIARGVVGLVNVKLSDGTHLIANKNITGFSNTEEEADKWLDKLPVHGALRTEMLENMIVARGAKYSKGRDVLVPHVKVDQRVITAQNAASASEFSKAVLFALNTEVPSPGSSLKRRPSLTQSFEALHVPQIFKEGWMDKMGHSLLSGWTRRWFSMHRRPDGEVVLEYWANETKLMSEHKGIFVIDEGTEIELETVSGHKDCFRLTNSHGSYLLSAGSVLEMDQWINVIRNRGRQRKMTMSDAGYQHYRDSTSGPVALPKKVNMMFTASAMIQCWVDDDRTSYSAFATEAIKVSVSGALSPAENYSVTGMDALWKVRQAMGDRSLDLHYCDCFVHTTAHTLQCNIRVCDEKTLVEKAVYKATFKFDLNDIKVTTVQQVKQ